MEIRVETILAFRLSAADAYFHFGQARLGQVSTPDNEGPLFEVLLEILQVKYKTFWLLPYLLRELS